MAQVKEDTGLRGFAWLLSLFGADPLRLERTVAEVNPEPVRIRAVSDDDGDCEISQHFSHRAEIVTGDGNLA